VLPLYGHISGVPTMMAMVLARKDLLNKVDTASVRTVMMGSAKSSPQLVRELKEYFTNAEPLVVCGFQTADLRFWTESSLNVWDSRIFHRPIGFHLRRQNFPTDRGKMSLPPRAVSIEGSASLKEVLVPCHHC
jgi:acyl-CoA synthetase (AMP-forming)/AMP-acid ligase II